MINIVFLGTSSMVPTKDRNHSALLLRYKDQGILFDCGEGTQRQLTIAGISPHAITKLCISHWHGDHVLGIPGLLQTLAMTKYEKTLEIYGPKGTKKQLQLLQKAFLFQERINIKVKEVSKGIFYKGDDFSLAAEQLQHGVLCLGYRFMEHDIRKIDLDKAKSFGLQQGILLGELQKGKTITHQGKKINPGQVTYMNPGKHVAIILDTVPCNGARKLAKDADLVICEATYAAKLEEKGENYGHMTATQAAQIASQANAKKLILTHFSQRYKDLDEVLQDAKLVFEETQCAYDFMKVTL